MKSNSKQALIAIAGVLLLGALGTLVLTTIMTNHVHTTYGTTPGIGDRREDYPGHPGEYCTRVMGVSPRIEWNLRGFYELPIRWEEIRIDSLPGVFEHGHHGIMEVGDRICGFREDTDYHWFDLRKGRYFPAVEMPTRFCGFDCGDNRIS